MINWDSMREALLAGLVITLFASFMTFAIFWGLYKVGVDFDKHSPCTCTCVKEG